MFNTDLLWYLLIPLVLSVGTVVGMLKIKVNFKASQLVGSCAVGLLISAMILFGAFSLGKGLQTSDIEILNGQVVDKTRTHGHYLRSYSCNCRSETSCSSDGSCTSHQVCDTCYEDRYTVSWDCQSTIGSFRIDHLDRGSRSVYNSPDPARYVSIKNGDPVSRTNRYTNYIKAVPNSLFRPAQQELRTQFASMIPAYPNRIYDIYRVNRVLGVGVSVSDISTWNNALSDMLKTLGPSHEVNAVIVFAKTEDPNYFHALQDAWINGKKNDVVLVVGVNTLSQAPLWVDVMALTQNSLFQVALRDRIKQLDHLAPETVLPVLEEVIKSDFRRRSMKDFKYLEAEIDPPAWVMWLAIVLIVTSYGGFWWYVMKHPQNRSYSRYGVPRFR